MRTKALFLFQQLQWGRGLKTPEKFTLEMMRFSLGVLQWGRGLKTPEKKPPP